ncbi:MAG: acyl-CoA thioesterase/bile acid-CoA:amino acid N-acyltransferase family protein, partial [Acidobacteriota bacterium]
QEWWSQNVFVADDHGDVDPARHPPVRGTYQGVHATGPFWSMVGGRRFSTESDAEVRIRVADKNGVLAERRMKWLSPRSHPGVTREQIRRQGLVADLYLPADPSGPAPAIVVVGGSGGGFNSERASLLATHGYAALDVAYHGVEGTPRYFIETLPIESFMRAIDLLQEDSRIDASRLAVMGKSYGAQLALLWASFDPRIGLVIAEAPSAYVTGTPASYPFGPVASAWSYAGRALPFRPSGEVSGEVSGAIDEEAVIPAERIQGPVLLLTGQADGLWESTPMATRLMRRLKVHQFGHAMSHFQYPEAGHNLGGGEQAYGVPNLPPKERGSSSGGTREGNSAAGVAAWAEALAFLRSHFE